MTRRNLKWSLSLLSLSVVMPAISFPSYADDTSSPHRPLPKSLKKEHARPTPVPLKKRKTASVISGNEAISVSGKRVRNHGAEVAVTRTIMERFIPGTNPMQVLSQSLRGPILPHPTRSVSIRRPTLSMSAALPRRRSEPRSMGCRSEHRDLPIRTVSPSLKP